MIRAGVQVVWIVDRDPFEIHVFEKGQAKRVLVRTTYWKLLQSCRDFREKVSRFVPPLNG